MDKEAKELFLRNRLPLLQKIAAEAEEEETSSEEKKPKKKKEKRKHSRTGSALAAGAVGTGVAVGGGTVARKIEGAGKKIGESFQTGADKAGPKTPPPAPVEGAKAKTPSRAVGGAKQVAKDMYRGVVPAKGTGSRMLRRGGLVGLPLAAITYAIMRRKKKQQA